MDEIKQDINLSEPADYLSFSAPSSADSSPRPLSKLLDKAFQNKEERKASFANEEKSDIVLGQLSYAPATQTTVVTTTTTTTTTFPPFMMKVPAKDPKLYPLAASSTPASVKRFQFKIGGQPAIFQEAEDVVATLKILNEECDTLKESGGKIQSASVLGTQFPETPRSQLTQKTSRRTLEGSKQRASGLCRTTSRNPITSAPKSRPSRLQMIQTVSPFTTPVTDFNTLSHTFRNTQGTHSSTAITPEMEDIEFPQISSSLQEQEIEISGQEETTRNIFTPVSLYTQTPSTREIMNRRTTSSSRGRPSILDIGSTRDASLPSPSLSPVTAAASMQNKRESFSESQDTSLLLEEPTNLSDPILGGHIQPFLQSDRFPSIQDIPVMLDAFESMPDEMKNYYIYQILRRCPKTVLHFVAETVNPALKRDFLGELPPELAQNVIKHLDTKSLCRASQVSKRWRKIVDTDEKIWKDLFDGAGFNLTEPELQRAIWEGWGWQSDPRLGGAEENVNVLGIPDKNSLIRTPIQSATETEGFLEEANPKRSKRKGVYNSNRASARKSRKSKSNVTDDFARFDTESLEKHMANVDGPYAAAEAALATVPSPDCGLPSLNVLHLYKSLYRRHYLFSRSWMQNKIEPRHLAFKAHNHNVVTCLQFDAERIVTGSDDNNINVYDTKTGALKAKLEGHDGGVWALQYVGDTLVSGSTDRSVRIWNMNTGRCTHTFLGHTSTVRCLIILMPTVIKRTSAGSIVMPKEPLIITGSRDSTLRVWKLPRPDDLEFIPNPADEQDCPYLLRTLSGHGQSVRAIAAHGDTLVSGSYDYTVRVWKISTGETVHRLVGHGQKVYSVVLDHERNRCISGSMDNLIKVWSLDTGTLLYNLEGHTLLVGLLDYQRGRLVSAAADSNLRIWDVDSGVCVKNLIGHSGAITCFQHDGVKIISGSDRSLKMWDVQTGEFVKDLLFDLSGVWQVKFDERRCVAAVQRNDQTYIEVRTTVQYFQAITNMKSAGH